MLSSKGSLIIAITPKKKYRLKVIAKLSFPSFKNQYSKRTNHQAGK